jgi:hypothetical protein
MPAVIDPAPHTVPQNPAHFPEVMDTVGLGRQRQKRVIDSSASATAESALQGSLVHGKINCNTAILDTFFS